MLLPSRAERLVRTKVTELELWFTPIWCHFFLIASLSCVTCCKITWWRGLDCSAHLDYLRFPEAITLSSVRQEKSVLLSNWSVFWIPKLPQIEIKYKLKNFWLRTVCLQYSILPLGGCSIYCTTPWLENNCTTYCTPHYNFNVIKILIYHLYRLHFLLIYIFYIYIFIYFFVYIKASWLFEKLTTPVKRRSRTTKALRFKTDLLTMDEHLLVFLVGFLFSSPWQQCSDANQYSCLKNNIVQTVPAALKWNGNSIV